LTAATIGNLNARLGLDTAEFSAGIARAQSGLVGLSNSLKGFAGGIGVGMLANLGVQAIKQVAAMGDLAEAIGVTAEQIQVYNKLSVASGSTSEAMARGLQSIAEQSVEAGSNLSKLFAANGLKAQGMEVNAVIQTFMDLLKNAKNPAEQLSIATKVLGDRIGRELVEALRGGSQAFDDMSTDMVAAGERMSDAEVARLQELETQYNIVADRIAAYWQKMIVGTVQGVDTLGSAFMELRRKGQEFIYGTTDEELGFDPLSGIRTPANTKSVPVVVTKMPEEEKKAGKTGGSSSGTKPPSWMSGTSENPLQEGSDVTGYDLRGNGLDVSDLTVELQEANTAAVDLANTIADSLAESVAGLAAGTMSFKDAWHNMAGSIIADLADIAAQLLKSGLISLLGQAGTSFGGAMGLGGFGGFYAEGGHLGAGEWGIAGEAGLEIVKGPASIEPVSGGGAMVFSPVYQIDARGADAGVEQRLRSELDRRDAEFNRKLPGMIRQARVGGKI
jgi:hypothetical protein